MAPAVNSIRGVWERQPGKDFCLSTRQKDKTEGGLKNYWFERYQFQKVSGTIRKLRDDYNVWFCPHGFKTKRRKGLLDDGTQNAEPSHFLYADCDEVDPRNAKRAPSMVIQSSPGRFVGLWYLGEPVPKEVNQAWTQLHKYDSGGWDVTQVLRVPRGRNHTTINHLGS